MARGSAGATRCRPWVMSQHGSARRKVAPLTTVLGRTRFGAARRQPGLRDSAPLSFPAPQAPAAEAFWTCSLVSHLTPSSPGAIVPTGMNHSHGFVPKTCNRMLVKPQTGAACKPRKPWRIRHDKGSGRATCSQFLEGPRSNGFTCRKAF